MLWIKKELKDAHVSGGVSNFSFSSGVLGRTIDRLFFSNSLSS